MPETVPETAVVVSAAAHDTDPIDDPIDPMDKVYRRRYRWIVWPLRAVALALLALVFLTLALMAYVWAYDSDQVAEILAAKRIGWDSFVYVLVVAAMFGWWVPEAVMEMPPFRRWAMGAPDCLDERETARVHRMSHHVLQFLTYGAMFAMIGSDFIPVVSGWRQAVYAVAGVVVFARVAGWLALRLMR